MTADLPDSAPPEALPILVRHALDAEETQAPAVPEALQRFHTRRAEAVSTAKYTRRATTGHILTGQWARVGFGIVVLTAVFIFGRQATRWHTPFERQVSGAVRMYATRARQRATMQLSDGSRVTLAPGTTLRARGRQIDLDGEAAFTVVAHESAPFTVTTHNTTIRVLGTTFFVRRYPSDTVTRVAVTAGRVVLRNALRSAILSTRMLGVASDSGLVRITPNVALDDYTAWTTGRLVFRDTPVGDAITELGRAYGVVLRVADSSLARHLLTWTVLVDRQSLSDVLDDLTVTLSAHLVRTGSMITIVPGGKAVSPRPLARPTFTGESQNGK